jgi:hypothetical protein
MPPVPRFLSLQVNAAWRLAREGKMTGKKTHYRRQDEQIGKVFRAVGDDLRQCLVCDQVFTRQAGREHAEMNCCRAVECFPVEPTKGAKHVTD